MTNRKSQCHSVNINKQMAIDHRDESAGKPALPLSNRGFIHEMARDVISTCPVCSSELAVTRLQCRGCGTAIEGDFNVGRFGRLSREQLALLESFLRARGNAKELERELKVSYPTVRAGESDFGRAGESAELRRDVLERLARHEITADEAAVLLRARKE